MTIFVRPYQVPDAPALAHYHGMIWPEKGHTAATFARRLEELHRRDGRAWVLIDDNAPAGYASVEPVPGLLGVFDLQGFIAPQKQRQGLGTYFLRHLFEELEQHRLGNSPQPSNLQTFNHSWQLSHAVTDPNSPAALFLRNHHFFVEHEEWRLVLDDLTQLPPLTLPTGYRLQDYPRPPLSSLLSLLSPQLPTGYRLQSYPRRLASAYFRQLYEKSFGQWPWYQPYASDAEVAAELEGDESDILFLLHQRKGSPIGFIWLHLRDAGWGEVEPMGLIPAYQGQSLGRVLLLAGLHWLSQRGAARVRLGAWRDNSVAIHLYQSLGFQHKQTITYLAYDI